MARQEQTTAHPSRTVQEAEEQALWVERSRIVLAPIAAPSILGLFGFAGATFMVGSWLAGWWGTALAPFIVAPFAATFGGLAQFLAGMWAYRARDGVATAMHGMWGAFWIAFGILAWAVGSGGLPTTALTSQAFGFWFIVLCVVTGFGALAALGDNMGIFTVLGILAVASGFMAAGTVGAIPVLVTIAGYLFVASAAAAFYTAAAMMIEESYGGRTILPLGKIGKGRANIPGKIATAPIQYRGGMPGSKVGQ